MAYFSLHLARTAMTKFIEKNVSLRAAALQLARAIKEEKGEEMSPTPPAFYSVTQHSASTWRRRPWAGGTMPAPVEGRSN